MTSEPSTPVRVPKAVATYSPTTLDPQLRSQINMVLINGGHISKIHDTLLHALNASPTNWPTLIHTHALTLLRTGEATNFPALMSRVLSDIKADNLSSPSSSQTTTQNSSQTQTNRINGEKGKGKEGKEGEGNGKGRGENGTSLALPVNVVEEGMRITRECLEMVCEVADS